MFDLLLKIINFLFTTFSVWIGTPFKRIFSKNNLKDNIKEKDDKQQS
ncbi:Uncharacterised protein [Staphylococcus aureus]|uniref:Uncharacterized protein n=1 Tax=Mammaliicoccus stepanovicii TaxID=643214 RepID=A0A239YI63_9STAP|nr:hypothetical protein [Mammaliicoccus stepanovicii]GGI40877.1 hypothetical protein GCM10010896_10560 [Mammaliicoccus stepanovicii]CPN96480.1 Uncharacterised protein [Staphylococcus aureus]SNV58420.1 Uncharacterised protein [Mammaliicoccus stepanovicii]